MSRDAGAFFAGLAAWVDRSSGTVHTYGDHADQHAVLRLPLDGPVRGTALIVHGGFWRSEYTKANTSAVAVALTRAGWATWNLEYRRVGSGGGYPRTLHDIASACRAFAPDIAVGHSAGGQLALWAAAEGVVRAAVALAGVCDLRAAAAARLGDGAVNEFLHADADPIRRVPLGVPTLLVHGSADDRVPVDQSRRFARTAQRAGDPCRLLEIEGADHFDVIDPRAECWREIEEAVNDVVS